jgi:formamidopyrimidine-DNA glycosylase
MPEFPDVSIYCDAIERVACGHVLIAVSVPSPFLLRSVEPPPQAALGMRVASVERIGKRIALGFDESLFFVIHLMIAGRLHWHAGRATTGRIAALSLELDNGVLSLTEAGTRKRASLHVIAGRTALNAMNPGGLEIFGADEHAFREAITRDNHTLKRALTDPRILSGIDNAYSDEILHHARLSPVKLTRVLGDAEIRRLYDSCRSVLRDWTERLRSDAGTGFPEKVTAFRAGMAVHGRYRQPCPDCSEPVQRIVYSRNECNYCARCQTGGRLLADRALSRLLKSDWPRTAEELEERLGRR